MVDIQRDFGRMEARQDATDDRLARIEAKLDEMLERTSVARGGIRMLISVGTIGAAFGSAVAEIVHALHGR